MSEAQAELPVTTRALVLGGGAPNATLMAGAVHTFLKQRIHFDIVSTSGAGALVGLLYLAPKNRTSEDALEQTVNSSIHDLIYSLLPINYKVFQKPLPYGEFYRDAAKLWLNYNPFYSNNPQDDQQRLISDWLALISNMALPFEVTPLSKGMCANVPFIDDIVDFDRLRAMRTPEFYLNAYNITDKRKECFSGKDMTPKHFQAAMAFPFIYPPVEINGKYYYEGAAHDCLNYAGLLYENPPAEDDPPATWFGRLRPSFKSSGRKEIVVLDVMGADELIRVPRDLWDAYNISIITPLVEIARDDTKLFEHVYLPKINGEFKKRGKDTKITLRKVDFRKVMNDELWTHSLDREYSNAKNLFELGRKAA
jgi:predicted acylesterase/phospholipase RssA